MASDVAATSGRLANYTQTEEIHNAKVNSQAVHTSDELLQRELRKVAYAVNPITLLPANAVVLARPVSMWSAELTGVISHFVDYKILM